MTNGEKLKEVFPDIEFTDMAYTVHAVAGVTSNGVKGHISYDFWKEWWNTEYKEPRKGYLSIDDVMEVFDDFMCGEVDEDGIDTFVEMLRDKADMREVEE